jgi:hypothetical protein|uniref:Uncharacterized protein n=1 Tax=Zea mays TaxID=4577 RepID=C0PCT0_MAIZE|nr:unknown [Zea mays]
MQTKPYEYGEGNAKWKTTIEGDLKRRKPDLLQSRTSGREKKGDKAGLFEL